MKQPIIINLGKSKALIDAAFAIVAASPMKFPTAESTHRVIINSYKDKGLQAFLYISTKSGHTTACDGNGRCHSYPWDNPLELDASKDGLARLAEELSGPTEIVIKGIGQYEAVIDPQKKDGAKIGCTFVTKEKIKEVWDALQD